MTIKRPKGKITRVMDHISIFVSQDGFSTPPSATFDGLPFISDSTFSSVEPFYVPRLEAHQYSRGPISPGGIQFPPILPSQLVDRDRALTHQFNHGSDDVRPPAPADIPPRSPRASPLTPLARKGLDQPVLHNSRTSPGRRKLTIDEETQVCEMAQQTSNLEPETERR